MYLSAESCHRFLGLQTPKIKAVCRYRQASAFTPGGKQGLTSRRVHLNVPSKSKHDGVEQEPMGRSAAAHNKPVLSSHFMPEESRILSSTASSGPSFTTPSFAGDRTVACEYGSARFNSCHCHWLSTAPQTHLCPLGVYYGFIVMDVKVKSSFLLLRRGHWPGDKHLN